MGGRGRDRRPNFVIFVVCSALIVGMWVVVRRNRKSYLGPAEITFFEFLALFKDGERRVSSRFSCVTSGMERFSLDLPKLLENIECALEVGCGGALSS